MTDLFNGASRIEAALTVRGPATNHVLLQEAGSEREWTIYVEC